MTSGWRSSSGPIDMNSKFQHVQIPCYSDIQCFTSTLHLGDILSNVRPFIVSFLIPNMRFSRAKQHVSYQSRELHPVQEALLR